MFIFWKSHRFVVFLQKQNNHENEAITINHDVALPDCSRSDSPDLQAGERHLLYEKDGCLLRGTTETRRVLPGGHEGLSCNGLVPWRWY